MLGWFAQTTLVAAGLAALAALACRSRRLGPEARHALWLVVLIKLAMPPVVAWPWPLPDAWPASASTPALPEATPPPRPVDPTGPIPAGPDASAIADLPTIPEPEPDPLPESVEPAPPPAPSGASQSSGISDFRPEPREIRPSPEDPTPGPMAHNPHHEKHDLKSAIRDRKSRLPRVLLALWLAGSVAVVARRAVAVARFRKSLARASGAPGWLAEEARTIGDRLGVRCPPILVAPGVATPLLWCLGRPRLILPASLVGRLGADRWPGIIAHELAHLARRDHWVVRLELLVEAVWWWNPVFFLARRRLREEAEHAADARVIRALPDRRFAYAEALVDVCESLTRSAIPSPALGVGGPGASRSLEGRLLMILRDPIPRRPGRRAALLAGLLAALSVPTWTLGQQPDASPKPDAPATQPKPAAPAADAPPRPDLPDDPSRPTAPIPGPLPRGDSDLTIEKIRAGFAKRLEGRGNLSFRYPLASRYRRGTGSEAVSVQVADVVLGPDQTSRLDILAPLFGPGPDGPDGTVRLFRQFVARDGSNLATFQARSEKGPVPFRWQSVGGRAVVLGDDLAVALMAGTGAQAVDRDRTVDPLEPRPASVLDLAGASTILLDPGDNNPAQAEVAGVEAVDGREVVRVAWFAYRDDGSGGGGLRGLLWVAPSLGFAVVRSEASQDPSQVGMTHGRRAWRKTSSDFVEVGGLWLPRKVELRFSEATPDGTPVTCRELVATIEDYRANPDLPPDTFHPRFKIEALDEQTGQFTTRPPEPAPGLADRLKRAVAESPFGPPRSAGPARMGDAQPTPARRDTDLRSANRAPGSPRTPASPNRAFADIVANVDEAPAGRLAFGPGSPVYGKPSPAATPAPAAGPSPAADPGKASPAPAAAPEPASVARPSTDPPADRDPLRAKVELEFSKDPQAIDLASQMKLARAKLDDIRRQVRTEGDPAFRKALETLKGLESRLEQLREVRLGQIREQVRLSVEAARDEVALQKSRRDVKAAAVRKAEAHRTLARAIVDRNSELLKKGPQYVSREERVKAEAELEVAEAEVAGKKAELAEADLGLEQASRRLVPAPNPGPARDSTADAPAAGGTLADLRDAVELMEVQLRGKQAELRGVEAKASTASRTVESVNLLAEQKAVGRGEVARAEADSKFAAAQVDQKQSEVLEFEVRLKQARRRAEAEEARLRREVERAKPRLEWAESMARKGFLSSSELEATRARYDELMFQLDPKHVPASSTAPTPPTVPR